MASGTLEVRDPGGTLVERREFHNALTGPGAGFLTQVLARQRTTGSWEVILSNAGGEVGPCADGDGRALACSLTEEVQENSPDRPALFPLTLEVPEEGDNAGKLILSGSVTAANDAAIRRVTTGNFPCDPTVVPDNVRDDPFCTGAPPVDPEFAFLTGGRPGRACRGLPRTSRSLWRS